MELNGSKASLKFSTQNTTHRFHTIHISKKLALDIILPIKTPLFYS